MKTTHYYSQKINDFEATIATVRKEDRQMSNYRLLGIALFCASFYLSATYSPYWLLASLAIFIGFYFLVKKHELTREKATQLENEKAFFENEIARSKGQAGKYNDGSEFNQENDQYASDLDVFGSFSLFQLINRAATRTGVLKLKDRFLLKESPHPVESIQEATEELSSQPAFTEGFLSSLHILLDGKDKTDAIYNFQFTDEIKNEKWIRIYLKAIPFLWISVLALGIFLNWTAFGVAAFAIMAINYSIVGKYKNLSEYYFTKTEGTYRILAPLAYGINAILDSSWKSGLLQKLSSNIPSTDGNPIKTFAHRVKKLETRKNQFAAFFMYLYAPFDVKQLLLLKDWHESQPFFFKEILEVVGEFEVLCSYALCLQNHEHWSIPKLTDKTPFTLKATKIGHPLIGNDSVPNDFEISPSNRLSLITGSNMSGKSTFLRALGTNLLLAYMGAPVCAQNLSVSKGVKIITYMRIKDDLNLNVSTFKAEINRVKLIVEAIESNENYLFLIDEMLRGTNSEDKLKGAVALLRKIANAQSYALVATHDLRATEVSKEYPDTIKNYFFEFRNVGQDLEFDYQIKAGVCESFNASLLLAQVGLTLNE